MDGFVANLYELWGSFYLGNFSNDMYQNGFYLPLFIIMIVTCILIPVIYYYIINHPRWNRWKHWLYFMLGTAVVNFLCTWIIASDKIYNYYAQQGMATPYDWTDYFILSSMAFGWSLVCFFLVSFVIKWWSTNSKHSPFV